MGLEKQAVRREVKFFFCGSGRARKWRVGDILMVGLLVFLVANWGPWDHVRGSRVMSVLHFSYLVILGS